MADWNDIKAAFEREANKANQQFVADEQKLLKSITIYMASLKGVSPLQGYNPNEVLVFLQKPAKEIKQLIGGDWLSVSDETMDTLIYSLTKKVQKSGQLVNEWQ